MKVSCKLENNWEKKTEDLNYDKIFIGKKPIIKEKEKTDCRKIVRRKKI